MPHISFSELKLWNECPWKHKLVYLEGIKAFEGNEHTAFGTAVHSTCEQLVENNISNAPEYFQEQFLKELQGLPENYELKKDLVVSMRVQGCMLSAHILPALKDYFGDYELVSVEEKLYEPIEGYDDYNFKGYIDLVLKTSDGKYHIIDWKTCSWGWDAKKKADKYITYQLTLYKKFWCEKYEVDPSLVETHFALLKRTAKKDNVEIFRVTSGPRKTENATKLLTNALIHISKGNHVKDRRSCSNCEFRKTEHCK